MRFLLAICLCLGTVFATSDFFILQGIEDYVDFVGSATIPRFRFQIKDPNTNNRTECVVSQEGRYYEDVKPSTWVRLSFLLSP